MGVCGSKGTVRVGNGPVEKYDKVDGPISHRNKVNEQTLTGSADEELKEGNQNNAEKRKELKEPVPGDDQKDIGSIPGVQIGTDPSTNLQIIDFDENEEYLQRLHQAYQRQPKKVTRKDLLADIYRMDFPRRGKAIVINNETFRDSPPRKGTYVDFSRICNRLERLGFQVERHNDVTCNQIMAAFVNSANEDHSDADCFAGVLLSHGGENEIHGTDGILKLDAIFELFKSSRCKTLAGKPKLFFIQACRGEVFDDGVNVNVADAVCMRGQPEEEIELSIPDDADFLISYSTVSGYYSWRNAQKGSWFIQALVRVLDECGSLLEIRKLLTRVNKIVAYEFESKDLRKTRRKQVPSFSSKLTKDLYFYPK